MKAALKAEGATPAQVAETLAELKAQRVAPKFAGALVIGADQMLSCNEMWFDKPPDRDHAAAQLRALSGKTHTLWTAVCVVRDGSRLRSEEHTSELQSLMRISYAVFCLKKKNKKTLVQQTEEEQNKK